MKTFKILSINDGGIRGIFPAMFLNQYQQKIAELQQQKSGLMQQLITGKTKAKIN